MPTKAPRRSVTIALRIRTAEGKRRYAKPVYAANHRLKPLHCYVNGKPTHHAEGIYALRYKDIEGRSVWEQVGVDAQQAQTAALQAETRLHNEGLGIVQPKIRRLAVVPIDERPTLQGKVDEYLLQVLGRRRQRTYATYSRALMDFVAGCKNRLLDDVRPADIDIYAAEVRKSGNGARTAANRIGALRSFFRWAGKPDVVLKASIPRFTDKIVAAYSPSQVQQLMSAASKADRLLWTFFLGSGCREQEVQFATWPDMDFEAGLFRVREKPDLGFSIKDGEEREVPLPDDLVAALQARRLARPKDRLLFPTAAGKPNGHHLRKLKKTAQKAGLNCGHCVTKKGISCADHPVCKQWDLHKFRKTFATMHHEAGVSPRTLMKWLGHSDFATTLRYLESADVRSERTRTLVNRTFGGLKMLEA